MKKNRKQRWLLAIYVSSMMVQAPAVLAQNQEDADQESGFLYFKEDPIPQSGEAASIDANISKINESRSFIDFDRDGVGTDQGNRNAFIVPFTPRQLDTQIDLISSTADGDADINGFDGQFSEHITPRSSGIRLAITSQVEHQATPPLTALFNPDADTDFSAQAVNVGLELGLSNFALSTGFIRRESAFDDLYYGLDVGLSYNAKSWRTSLQVTGQQAERSSGFIDLSGAHDRFFAVSLGAAYDLTPSWSLTGGLRYTGFKGRFDFGLDQNAIDGRVYMGTALTF